MCGIAGIHMKRPGTIEGRKIERLVDQLLLGIEHRGRDATGIAACTVGGKRVLMSKEPIKASDFIKVRPSLVTPDNDLRTVILHTRFATQGRPEQNVNNHPVLHGTTFVTHNGHISNDSQLFRENEIQRLGEVDSEIIPALIQKHGLDKVHLALQELEGGFAIAAMNPTDFPDQLVLAKGTSSPLMILENDNFIIWASELGAIKDAWGDVLGTPPRDRKFESLGEGDLLYIEGDSSEAMTFEVKRRYVYYGSSCGTGYSTTSTTGRSALCECGHTRFWHSGKDSLGSCVGSLEATGDRLCPCIEFLQDENEIGASTGGGSVWIDCDSCGSWEPESQMEHIYGNYWMCEDCLGGPIGTLSEDDEDEEAEDTRPNLTLLQGEPNEAIKLLEAGEPTISVAQERHNHLLSKTAQETGYNVEFVEWVLFRAPLDQVQGDHWLAEAREACDTAYADFEDELNKWEDEIKVEHKSDGSKIVSAIVDRILH